MRSLGKRAQLEKMSMAQHSPGRDHGDKGQSAKTKNKKPWRSEASQESATWRWEGFSRNWSAISPDQVQSGSIRTVSQLNIGKRGFFRLHSGYTHHGEKMGENRDCEYNKLLNFPLNRSREIRQKLEVMWVQGRTFLKMKDIVACLFADLDDSVEQKKMWWRKSPNESQNK